jgi:hypothetical protein
MELEFKDYLRLGLYLLYFAERDYFILNVYKRIAYSR